MATLAPMSKESWADFVRRVTSGLTQTQAAYLAGVTQTAVGRWERGDTEAPRAESVVAACRGWGAKPVEGLVAAGYLNPDEAEGAIEVRSTLRDFSSEQLLDELRRRVIDAANGGESLA